MEKVRKIVRKEADDEDWKYHIIPVVKYAKKLAEILDADKETVELAALLHDIGRLKFGNKDHHLTGAPEAEIILRKLNYPERVIEEVKHCVMSHRGSKDIPQETKSAKIIANADAMAHFDVLPVFFYWRSKKESFEEAFIWFKEKVERDWNKKLTIPEAKAMMREKYKTIRKILEWNGQYMS